MEKEELKSKVFGNFNRKTKWLGLVDYKTLIFLAIYVYSIYCVTGIFKIQVLARIYILVIFSIPVLILTTMYMSEESVVDMFITVLKYVVKPKRYVHIPKKSDDIGLVVSGDTKKF